MRAGPRILTGTMAGMKLEVISGVRPTVERVRRSLIDIIAPKIENSAFIDVCSGSGIIGFEALSRGAEHVVFIDKNPKVCNNLRSIVRSKNLSNSTTILQGNAVSTIPKALKRHDQSILFIDPPYSEPLADDILESIKSNGMLSKVMMAIVEHHHKTPISISDTDWIVNRVEKYGETQLTFLKALTNNTESQQ